MSQVITFDYVPEEELLASKNENRQKPTKAYFSAGQARFKIIAIEEGFSHAGKPKTMFHLEIEDIHGKKGKRTEHVSNKAALKFMHISEAIGGGIYVKGGFVPEKVIGKSGLLVFGIKETEEWGAQNEVLEWIPYKPQMQDSNVSVEDMDDDIPF